MTVSLALALAACAFAQQAVTVDELPAVREGLASLGAAPEAPAIEEGNKRRREGARFRLVAGKIGGELGLEAGSAGVVVGVPLARRAAGTLSLEASAILTHRRGLDRRIGGTVVHVGRLPTDRGVEDVALERNVYERGGGPWTLELVGLAYRPPALGPLAVQAGVRGGLGYRDATVRVVEQELWLIGGRREAGPETPLSASEEGGRPIGGYAAAFAGAELRLGRVGVGLEASKPVYDPRGAGGSALRGGLSLGF